jgi:HAD superfamily phosphoserine phosphatase-like hydrolase
MFSKLNRDINQLPDFFKDLPEDGSGKLALFDADGTLWRGDVADDFTRWAIDNKLLKHGELWDEYLRIYAENPTAGCPYLLKLYKDVSQEDIIEGAQEWWTNHSRRDWITEVIESLHSLSERGYTNWIVTASPTSIISPLLSVLPIKRVVGIDFALDDKGIITGEVGGICCSGPGKAEKILSLSDNKEIHFSVGNSSMDIPMIELSTIVNWSLHPDEQFHGEAKKLGWTITERPSDFVKEEKFE